MHAELDCTVATSVAICGAVIVIAVLVTESVIAQLRTSARDATAMQRDRLGLNQPAIALL